MLRCWNRAKFGEQRADGGESSGPWALLRELKNRSTSKTKVQDGELAAYTEVALYKMRNW